MKVVINRCWGGFSISFEAAQHMAAAGSPRAKKMVEEHEEELRQFALYRDKGIQPPDNERNFRTGMWDISIKYHKEPDFHGYVYADGFEGGVERNDPLLAAAVEALGEKANGSHAELRVVEIPDGVEYEISDYDGMEHIAEKHRTWA